MIEDLNGAIWSESVLHLRGVLCCLRDLVRQIWFVRKIISDYPFAISCSIERVALNGDTKLGCILIGWRRRNG
jgi:hypothetical protein